jgi:magnesium-transporting ATPase (P-type)
MNAHARTHRTWWQQALLFIFCLVLLIGLFVALAWLSLRGELERFFCVGPPVFVWCVIAGQNRRFFRQAWFWWTSITFLLVATAAGAFSPFAHRGAWMMHWMVLTSVEGLSFIVAVDLVSRRMGTHSHDREDRR